MATGEKNIHDGHRERLTEMIYKAGIENVSDVTAVEFFLTYIFPRGDVNPLAHRLIDQFRTFTHILEADVVELAKVKGINERSAKKIHMFLDIINLYAEARIGKKFEIECRGDLLDALEDSLRLRTTENMVLFAVSPAGVVTHRKRFVATSNISVNISVLDLTSFISSTKPASLIVAHCHPYGKSTPSPQDGDAFKMIEDVCRTCGIFLSDSYIVGEDGIYSQREDKLVRNFLEPMKIVDALNNMAKEKKKLIVFDDQK